jgi:hypothetical protein
MARLGLPDFETWEQCAERQGKMAKRFQNAGEQLAGDGDWQRCGPTSAFACGA